MSTVAKIGLATVAAALLFLCLVLPVMEGIKHRDHFNDWISDCLALDGTVGLTQINSGGNRYECFVDSQIVTVPGYEGE